MMKSFNPYTTFEGNDTPELQAGSPVEYEKLTEPIERILFTEEQIQARIAELGKQITSDFMGRDLLVVCILKGSLYFTADLIRSIRIPLKLDFMAVTSYGAATHTSGMGRITKDLDEDIEGRHVILVEDIIDSGLTLDYLIRLLRLRNPADIKICSLLDKPSRRKKENIKPDYLGFEIPDEFVVGYGLDYQHKYRHLPYVCVFKKEYLTAKKNG